MESRLETELAARSSLELGQIREYAQIHDLAAEFRRMVTQLGACTTSAGRPTALCKGHRPVESSWQAPEPVHTLAEDDPGVRADVRGCNGVATPG